MIEAGSLVTWSKSKKPGRVWRVETLFLHPRSHSAIPIVGASLRPAGEPGATVPRPALLADLTLYHDPGDTAA